MRKILGLCVLSGLSALMLGGCVGAPEPGEEGTTVQAQDPAPEGKGARTLDGFTLENFASPDGQGKPGGQAKPGGGNGITNHGGPVMHGTVNVHYIWYGNHAASVKNTLTTFANNIGGSAYFNINKAYTDSTGAVSGLVAKSADASDNYSQGTALSDAAIQAIVAAQNPTDTNGVYFVLTDPTVNATSGFCTQYCGWHTHGTIGGKDIKYSFVGNSNRCPASCAAQNTGPNGTDGSDGMASIIAHELEEATTDPDLNAWYDTRGYENADKCAWTFGTTSTAANGALYNVTLGGTQFLIQQNWRNANGGSCGMQ